MLRHWTLAARAIRHPVDETLARVATDIAQYPDTRYVAVDELAAERESTLGRRALETVLVESGSDGLLRRKAAQALRTVLPQAELCALLERVGALETDQAFALFLADMLTKNCP
jgi:histidinol-phosphate/aromatic aminotransferase/cobyric acid decarboxylase-like protein